MINPLDNLDVYELEEAFEGESLMKALTTKRYTNEFQQVMGPLTILHKGNVRRLIRAGYRMYKRKDSTAIYNAVHPEHREFKSDSFTPVLLENNKLVGL